MVKIDFIINGFSDALHLADNHGLTDAEIDAVSKYVANGLKADDAAGAAVFAGACAACHGASFEKVALGKSGVVNGQSAAAIEASLKGYKAGTLNKNGMGALMKGQVATMSDADMKALASYIAGIK